MPRDGVGEALARFEEATRRKAAYKARRKLETTLEPAIARAFARQGAAVQREFRKLAKAWPVPVTEARRAPWLALLAEADDTPAWPGWEAAFERAAKATLKLFAGPIDSATTTAILQGAKAVVASVKAAVNFKQRNTRAEAWLEGRAAERVTLINDTTRDRIGTLVKAGMRDGLSYNEVAKRIAAEFKEFGEGKPQKHIESRAHLVAVTEVGEAYTEGTLQAAQDLDAYGIPMEKSWDDVGDGKVSAGCLANSAAGWIVLGEDFPSGHARPLRFPGCRCDLFTRPKED